MWKNINQKHLQICLTYSTVMIMRIMANSHLPYGIDTYENSEQQTKAKNNNKMGCTEKWLYFAL